MPFGVEDTNCQEFSKVIKVKPRLFDALKSKKVVKVVDSNIFKVCSNVNSKTHTAIYRAESETDAIKAYILQALEAKLNVELCSVTASPIELVDALIYWENL